MAASNLIPILLCLCIWNVVRGNEAVSSEPPSDCNLDSPLVKFYFYKKPDYEWPDHLRYAPGYVSPWIQESLCRIECPKKKATMIIIHGFDTNDYSRIWGVKHTVRRVFAHHTNIIEVDWQTASEGLLNYFDIVENTVPKIYDSILLLLEYLHGRGCSNIGIIGNSLGAHIAGKSARIYKEAYNTSIDLIVGLDPAGPNFDKDYTFTIGASITIPLRRKRSLLFGRPTDNSLLFATLQSTSSTRYLEYGLSKEDADRVIVFYTDTACLGIDKDIGDIDIYPNDGFGQPYCCYPSPWCLPKWMGCTYGFVCSHGWAVEGFAYESVVGKIVTAYPDLLLEEMEGPLEEEEEPLNVTSPHNYDLYHKLSHVTIEWNRIVALLISVLSLIVAVGWCCFACRNCRRTERIRHRLNEIEMQLQSCKMS